MCVRDVEVHSVKMPRKATWSLQRGRIPSHSMFTIVKMTTEDGVVGWGEAAIPMPAIRHLIEDYMVDIVVGSNPLDVERIHREIDKVEMMVMERVGFWNPARAAVDIALHDLIGKYLEIPVWRLLGSRYRHRIPMTKNVGVEGVEDSVSVAEEIAKQGYKVIKVRVGGDRELDVARLAALRDRLGSDLRFRVDANQAWRPKTAIALIRRMEEFGLESVEQPVKRWDIPGSREVVANVGVPVMADEGFWTRDEALQLLREQAADILHLYLSKCGGLYPALKIVELAEAFDVSVTLGERIPLGICEAADAHFAAAITDLEYPCAISYDLNEHDLLTESLRRENGALLVPSGPGLGITVDEERLKHYSIRNL